MDGFPVSQEQCALGDKCVDDCSNCTIGWIPNVGESRDE